MNSRLATRRLAWFAVAVVVVILVYVSNSVSAGACEVSVAHRVAGPLGRDFFVLPESESSPDTYPVQKPFFTEPDSHHDPVQEPHHLTAFASRGSESATPDRWLLTCSKLVGERFTRRSVAEEDTRESWRYLDSSSGSGVTSSGPRSTSPTPGTHSLLTPHGGSGR